MRKQKTDMYLDRIRMNAEETNRMVSNQAFWEANADKFKCSNRVSWGDKYMMRLEIETVGSYIKGNSLVLDAGCSNGFSTFEIVKNKRITVKAFDYSKKSIGAAKKQQPAKDPKNKITFTCGNILNICAADNTFDAGYTIRVLINLPAWLRQKQAILEMWRVLKPGGLYLMSEAFLGSLKKLNALRAMADMKPLTVHEFNLYLEEKKLERFVKRYFDIVEIRKFSSIYYVASRFLRYLTMDRDEKDSYENSINRMFSRYSDMPNSGDFGIQKLYVLKKR